jgi:hypothetical protein
MICAVVAAVLIAVLARIVLPSVRSSGSGAALRGSYDDDPDAIREPETAAGHRLIVEEWRDGDLVAIGTVTVDEENPADDLP